MMKTFLFFLALLMGISSCKKEKQQNLCDEPALSGNSCVTDSSQIKILVLGKWNWTKQEVYGISGYTSSNPCTANINYAYEFFADGTVKYYENGNLLQTNTYHFDNNSNFRILVNPMCVGCAEHSSAMGWVSICNGYLVIDNSPVDGPKDIFERAD